MSENEHEVVSAVCPKCGTEFLPFGYQKSNVRLMREQVLANLKCPKCGYNFILWFDTELKREWIKKELGLASKEKAIEERIKIINQLMNTFLGLDSEASLEDTKERAKEIGEVWAILIELKDDLNKKKDKWFGS